MGKPFECKNILYFRFDEIDSIMDPFILTWTEMSVNKCKNAEKWAKSASSKTGLFVNFFSKCCHSKTNKDNDMKPKLVEA